MKTTGRVLDILKDRTCDLIKVDKIGIGKGVADRLNENNIPVEEMSVGNNPIVEDGDEKDLFLNKKAQGYKRLRDIFENKKISIEFDANNLIGELTQIEKSHTSSGKMRIEDPDKSPDHADSLMLSLVQSDENEGWGFAVTDI